MGHRHSLHSMGDLDIPRIQQGDINRSRAATVKALSHYALFHWRFGFFSRFCHVYPQVYDTNMLVSKTQVKTQEKREKNVSILHYGQ